jgi:predicted nucleic acid-binding protein
LSDTLFDTSIYITAMRRTGDWVRSLQRFTVGGSLWLSAVVLEELYAGAGERSRAWVELLKREFVRENRILVPNLEDWTQTGAVLNRLALKYDYELVGRGRLTNDALIATSAGRLGIKVLTANAKDFRRLAEFRDFQWEVATI